MGAKYLFILCRFFNQTFMDGCAFMFYGDTALGGYVPKTLFANIVDSNSSNNDEQIPTLMYTIFDGTGLATSCDSYNLTQYITGFEDYWNGHVSCAPAAVGSSPTASRPMRVV